MSGDLLTARGLEVTFTGSSRAARRQGRRRSRPRRRVSARSSPWWASRDAARRPWPARCSACERPSAGEVTYEGEAAELPHGRTCGDYRRRVQLILQDPSGVPQPPAERLRVGGRGHPDPQAGRAGTTRPARQVTETDLVSQALSQAGLRPPERFFLASRTSSPGGSASAWSSPVRWRSSRKCWLPMSRSRASMRPSAARSWRCC